MASAEALVVFKARAARPKDIQDAAALILMHPTIDLGRVRRQLAGLAELAEEPALLEGLDEVVGRAREVRKALRKTTGKKKTASAATRKVATKGQH